MKNDGLDPKLKNALNDLQNIPPRNPQSAARRRANFLEQAAAFRQTVSREAEHRHNRWYDQIFPLFQRKERLPVLNTLFAVVLAVAALFGGTGGTVYAAQASLPDQALYPVKTWSEDVILSMTGPAQTRLNYALDFSDRRVAEMASLLYAGKSIPDGVETRLQSELDLALHLVAGMDDPQAVQQLSQIRQRADALAQTMVGLISGAPGSTGPLLAMAHARLQEQIQLATIGETDMTGFRMQVEQHFQNQESSGEPTPSSGNGPMSPTEMPGNGGDNGPMNPTEMPGTGGGSGTMSPTEMPGQDMNQPTGMTGPSGSGTQTPMMPRQPGGDSGHMP